MTDFERKRFQDLLAYLEKLIDLKKTDYKVYDEIQQVLAEIKNVLELNKK